MHLDTNWGFVGILIYPETDHDTKADGQLLQGDQSTTHFRGGAFGVVNGDNHGQTANSHSSVQQHQIELAKPF